MPTGSTPSASATGSSVTVGWAVAQLGNGTPAAGYVIHRYNNNGTSFPVGGTCAGTVTATTCSETVGSGTWFHTERRY